MARIVGIHGIAQQVRGPEVLRAVWAPALRDGVALSGAEPPDEADLRIAFYGDLFRAPGTKAAGDPQHVAADVEEGFERELLEAWWAGAAATDEAVPGPDAKTKLRTPKTVQRALNALSQSRFFAGLTERLIIGFIKQVHAYLTDDSVRAEIQARVERVVGPGTAVLVGHSLGSVVAYEAACAHPDWDLTLVTLGCPLGIRNLVFERLRPPPEHGRGHFPAGAAAWTNIADAGDVVALVKRLTPLFGERVLDLAVDNGSKAHDISPYLTAAQTGHAIVEGLMRRAD
jgi:pimeloyl-ACP methyl ester carboxylesterase